MANQQLDIMNASGGANAKYIVVDHGVLELKAGEVIIFKNYLKGPPKEANVQFFLENTKTSSGAAAIPDFCTKMDTQKKAFLVPQSTQGGQVPGEGVCTVTKSVSAKVYEYTIAADSYETLDPVIIIEGGNFDFMGSLWGPLTVLLTGGLVATYLRMKMEYKRGYADGSAATGHNQAADDS